MEDNSDNKQAEKWYFKTGAVVVSILLAGPFALPLVWKNKRFSRNTKIIITVVVLVLTVWLMVATFKSIALISDFYRQQMQELAPLN
jgi:hypothetical protein